MRYGEWLLALSDPRAAGELTELAGAVAAGSVGEALELAEEFSPRLLAADLTLPGGGARALFCAIGESDAPSLPVAVALAVNGMEPFGLEAVRAGAYRCLTRPVGQDALAALMAGAGPGARLPRAWAEEGRIRELLAALGFSPRLAGSRCLVHLIDLAARDSGLLKRLTKELYPAVAQRMETSPARVEHAVRRAIESAWSNGPIEAQHRAFGNSIDEKRAKPTAGELIARAVELLRAGRGIGNANTKEICL